MTSRKEGEGDKAFFMREIGDIWMTVQVVRVLGKLDKWKYPEYNLGNTRTAKLNNKYSVVSFVKRQ